MSNLGEIAKLPALPAKEAIIMENEPIEDQLVEEPMEDQLLDANHVSVN
jgi:hypothetical protein